MGGPGEPAVPPESSSTRNGASRAQRRLPCSISGGAVTIVCVCARAWCQQLEYAHRTFTFKTCCRGGQLVRDDTERVATGTGTRMTAEDDEDFHEKLAYTFQQMANGADAVNYLQLRKWIAEQMRADEDLEVKGITEEMQKAATDAFAAHKRDSDDMLGIDEVADLLRGVCARALVRFCV